MILNNNIINFDLRIFRTLFKKEKYHMNETIEHLTHLTGGYGEIDANI